MKKIADLGRKLVIISTFLFAISIPISMAVDNIAAGIGVLGILFLLLGKKCFPCPPLKPLAFLLTPQTLEAILLYPRKLFKTDLNLHLVPYYSVFRTLKERQNFLFPILYLLAFSITLLDFSVVLEAFTWQNIKCIHLSSLSFHTQPIRAKGFLDNPLTTAGVIFPVLILFIGVYFQFRRKLFLIPVFTSMAALLFTESRSYWVGFAVFVISLLFFFRNKKAFVFVLSCFLLFSASFQIPQIKDRFESIFNTKSNYSNIDRLALWKANVSAFVKDYSLSQKIFGAGYKAGELAWKEFKECFNSVSPSKLNSDEQLKRHFHGGLTHNIYLRYLTKYGVLGLIGFILFWIIVFYYNYSYKGSFRVLIRILSAGYLGFLAAGFFENNFVDAEVQFALFFILGVNFALLQVMSEEKRT